LSTLDVLEATVANDIQGHIKFLSNIFPTTTATSSLQIMCSSSEAVGNLAGSITDTKGMAG